MYVLDTDIVSLIMRGRLPDVAVRRLDRIDDRQIKITSVTLGELYYGALKTSAARRWLAAVDQLRRTTACLGFDADAAADYGALRAHLEAKGRRLDDADLRIAAICRSTRHTLVSGNAKHFARVPELKYENWLTL